MQLTRALTIRLVLVLAAYGVFAWIIWPAPAPVLPMVPAVPAPVLKTVEKITIAPPAVQVYAPKAKKKLKLPAAMQADPAQHVIAASQVRADERPHTVITLLDERTGEATTYDRADPLPWMAPETRGELGISYGLRDGAPMGRLSLRQNVLQIKAVRLGAQANIDQDGQWFVGLGVFYRW